MKIGIIGAGPRGLSVAERILHNNQDRHSLELFLFRSQWSWRSSLAVESATGVINEFCFSTSDAFYR